MFAKQFPECTVIDWTNATGADVAAGELIDMGVQGVGHADTKIVNGDLGAVSLRGCVYVTKQGGAGVTFAQGAPVYYDKQNKRASAAPTAWGKCIGVAAYAAADADTEVKVNLNEVPVGGRVFVRSVVGDGSGAGLTVDTNWGVDVTGCVFVISRQANGTLRTITSITRLTAGNTGKITIVTTAGAGTDIHDILVIQ